MDTRKIQNFIKILDIQFQLKIYMLLVLMPLSIIEIIFIYIGYNRMEVKPNAKIKITEYGANKLMLDTMYYIEFPKIYLNIKDQWAIRED